MLIFKKWETWHLIQNTFLLYTRLQGYPLDFDEICKETLFQKEDLKKCANSFNEIIYLDFMPNYIKT